MKRARWLAMNALTYLAANILSKLILAVGSFFLMQHLNPEDENIYALVTAITLLVVSNFQDGMVQITIQKIATDKPSGAKYIGVLFLSTLLLTIFIAFLGFLIIFTYGIVQITDAAVRREYMLSSMALIGAYLAGYGYSVAGAGFKGYEKLYLESILAVIQAILNMLIFWYGSIHGWQLHAFFIGLLAANLFHSIISFLVLIRLVAVPHLKGVNITDCKELFRHSLGLGYATFLRTIQDRIHIFLIQSLLGHNVVNQFDRPNALLIQFKFIPASIKPAVFPTLARKAELSTDEFRKYSTALVKFLYLTGIPLMLLLIIAKNEILPLFTQMGPGFKEQYGEALRVYGLIAFAVALSFGSQVLRNIFVAIKKPEWEFQTVVAGVIALTFIDIIAIKLLGIIGAGIGALAGECVIVIFGIWLLMKIGRGINWISVFLLPTVCGIITFLMASVLYAINWLAGLVAVIVIFPVLTLMMRIITKDEWTIIKEMIRSK